MKLTIRKHPGYVPDPWQVTDGRYEEWHPSWSVAMAAARAWLAETMPGRMTP